MQLKRKYGLQKDHFVAAPAVLAADYVDRARVRRDVVGSEHPSHERPTESASVSVPIPVENKGFQMLSKMGWTEGEGLNAKRKADSISEPISSVIRTNETAGLGSDVVGEIMSMNDARSRQQQEKWAKTVKRYHGLPTMNMRERTVDPGTIYLHSTKKRKNRKPVMFVMHRGLAVSSNGRCIAVLFLFESGLFLVVLTLALTLIQCPVQIYMANNRVSCSLVLFSFNFER